MVLLQLGVLEQLRLAGVVEDVKAGPPPDSIHAVLGVAPIPLLRAAALSSVLSICPLRAQHLQPAITQRCNPAQPRPAPLGWHCQAGTLHISFLAGGSIGGNSRGKSCRAVMSTRELRCSASWVPAMCSCHSSRGHAACFPYVIKAGGAPSIAEQAAGCQPGCSCRGTAEHAACRHAGRVTPSVTMGCAVCTHTAQAIKRSQGQLLQLRRASRWQLHALGGGSRVLAVL